MADYSLGTAHGQIKIDADTSGVDQTEKALGRVNKSAQSTEQAMDKTARGTGLAGAAIAGGLGLAVKTAADFEFQMSAIKSVSGASAVEMDKIRDAALRIGTDTKFSATEAASAMEELAKAGLPIEDILGGAADATVALAAATGTGLANAATIASDTMNMFGLKAKDMSGVVDTLAQTANASSIGIDDLGMAFSQVGAVANLVGLDVAETASAIGQLGDEGIKGSDAGTSLKTMLMNLQPSTKAQTAAMRELGLITEDGKNQFFDANGELKSLRDVQEVLHNSTKDLTDAQKMQKLETIFGTDAIRAAAVMAENGAKGFDLFANKQKETGTAAEQAKIRQDNLRSAVEQLGGALETAGITIGSALTPMLRWLAETLGVLVGWFNSLTPEQQQWIAGILASVAGLLLLTAGVLKTILMFKNMIGVMRALGILSTATRAGFIKTAAQFVISTIRMVAAGVVWVAQMLAQSAVVAARWAWLGLQALAQGARVAAAWLLTHGVAAATAVVQTLLAVGRIIAGWVLMGVQSLLQAARVAAAWLIAMGPIGWVIAAVIALVALIIANWDKVKEWTIKAWNALVGAIKTAASNVWNAIKSMASSVSSAVSSLWSNVKSAFSSGVNAVTGFVRGLPGTIKNFFADAGSWLLSAGKALLQGLWNGISGAGGWLKDKVLGWANGLVDDVLGFFGINSPSKLFAWMGENLALGLSLGIDDQASSAIQSALSMADQVSGVVSMSAGGSDAFWDGTALGSGNVPVSPEVASYAASQSDPNGAGPTYTFNTYNPVAERASDSEARRLRALSALGAF